MKSFIQAGISFAIILGSLLLSIPGLAQSLYVRPVLGIGFPVSKITESNSDIIGQNNSNSQLNLGLYLQSSFQNGSSISMGYLQRSIGYGFSITLNRQFSRTSVTYPLNSFIINYNYPVVRVKFGEFKKKRKELEKLQLTEEQYYYLAIFDIELIIGLNFNTVSNPELASFQSSLGPIEYTKESTLVNNSNFSIPIGLRLQFYSFGKRRLQFDLIYNLGLSELVRNEITYNLINQQETYSSTIVSKGSEIEIHFGYPVNLKRKK